MSSLAAKKLALSGQKISRATSLLLKYYG